MCDGWKNNLEHPGETTNILALYHAENNKLV